MKDLLGVQKQTTNIGVLLELGKLPIAIHAQTASVKNWERIVAGKANELLLNSHTRATTFSLPWIETIKERLSTIGMRENFLDPSSQRHQGTHKHFYKRLSDIHHQNAITIINDESSKLRTYALLKNKPGMSAYITEISSTKDRVALSKSRLSNHKLHIETGRFCNLDETRRVCPFCKNQVENEIHFLITCPTYNVLRNPLFLKIQENARYFELLSDREKFIRILAEPNAAVASYVYKIMELREFLINSYRQKN